MGSNSTREVTMKVINAIVAVGNQGQIGLKGKIPWSDLHDLIWFKNMTMDSIVICGYNTYKDLPKLEGRIVVLDNKDSTPEEFLESIRTDKPIWIIGGAKTYEKYKHLINRWYISKINYDGEADTYFDYSVISG